MEYNVTYQKKQYNLNAVLSFDLLKEVLFKLLISQENIEKELDKIKKSNKKRDKDISKYKNLLKENLGLVSEDFSAENEEFNESEQEKENEPQKQYESEGEKAKRETKEDYNIINETDKDKNFIKQEQNTFKGEQDQLNKDNNNNEINKNINDENNIKNKEKVQKQNFNYSKESFNTQIGQNQSQIPPDLIRNMAKQIKDNKKRIIDLEKRLRNEIKKNTDLLKKDYRKLISDHSSENKKDLKEINSKLDDLFNTKEYLENKMDDCVSKCSTIDIYNMFRDSGDGSVDAAKVMVKALEEKVFKKFELVDMRYKKDAIENKNTKINVDNLLPKVEKMNEELLKFQNNEEVNNEIKDFEQKINEMKLLIDDNNKNLMKNLERIKNDFDNIIKNKLNELENKINKIKSNDNEGTTELFKLGFGNKGVDEELLQVIEKKINDLRKKNNDLENTIKLLTNNKDIEDIQNELKNLKLLVDKKITREDLKELYNFHLSDVDELNDLKDNVTITFDDLRKIKNEITNIIQKLDNINGNIVLLQNSHSVGGAQPIINFDKYVDQQKFADTLKPIMKEIEKIYREIDSFSRNLSEIESISKSFIKNERLSRLEDEINNKLNELKINMQKKFVDKADFAKNIKQLEIQIKTLDMESKKSDADSWIMGKKPVGCFNCATCEANIKNENPQNEYLAWNKYPHQDKIYRMGQGFSHMLQMMTSEFIRSINNEKENDSEYTSRTNNLVLEKNQLNIPNDERKQSASVLKINNKEQINDEMLKKINNYNLYTSRVKSKFQLPRVLQFKKRLKLKNDTLGNIPVSDDEYSGRKNSIEKDGDKDKISPKITKILKKKNFKTEDNFDNQVNHTKY